MILSVVKTAKDRKHKTAQATLAKREQKGRICTSTVATPSKKPIEQAKQ